MEIRRALPDPRLRGVVRAFEERRAELGGATLSWSVAARPHQILNINLAEPFRVRFDHGQASATPEVGVAGPLTDRRAHVSLSGSIHAFHILFQPTGLNRLVGLNVASLANENAAASDVLGPKAAAALRDAVRSAPDFDRRVAAVERWIGTMFERWAGDCAVGLASRRMIAARGGARIENLVAQSGFSASQFARRFETQVGMTPKLFARMIRFDRALSAHRDAPNRPWTEIVHEFGYFDQAHFIRECHAFTGLAPSGLVGDWNNLFCPEG